MSTLSRDNDGGWLTLVIEEVAESSADSHVIGLGDTEGSGGKTDLFDEVGNLCVGEIHEFVGLIQGCIASVGWIC